MLLGLNRGEIILTTIIFSMIYLAGLLPKIVRRLGGVTPPPRPED